MVGKYSIKDLLRFSDRGASSLATSLLDQIVSQAEVDKQNALYRLANYRKGGLLVEAYLKGGKKELERMATEEMKDYMYRGGGGEVLGEQAFTQWRNSCNDNNNQVIIPMDDNGSPNEHRETAKPHLVCWKLEYRGMLGESLFHVLVICNTDVHSMMAEILLKLYPALAKDIVEGDEYYGVSTLHFAIAYENGQLAKNLVEAGADVVQRATGRFFLPTDQQWPIPRKKSNFEGLSYLGEYPLAWAACCEDEASYNLLLKYGADPNMQDSFGNSILHVVVIRDKLKMYGYALRHPTRPASDRLYNRYGLTPLTLACKLGRNKIFREMLELSSLEFWRYSNITCSGYPLNALDSLQPNGKTNQNSALMIILNGSTTEHLDMLEGGVIQRLLEEKWKTFAQRCFYRRLCLMLLHLLNISIAVFLRPTTKEPLLGKIDATTIARYCAEIGACIGCVGFAIFQQVQEILAQGFVGSLINLMSSPSKLFFVISCLLILSCIPCRVIGDRSTEDFLLAVAIPGSWFFLIFFAGAVRLTGPFVTMIYSMLVGDMFRFSIIYTIFLFGFTQAFYFLFKNSPSEKGDSKKRFTTFPVTWMGLFHMTLGSYEYEDFRETFYQKLTQLVFAMFMVFTPILLLNMLIAMMGNTYCEVITQSEKEWVKQWAKIVVVLEQAIDNKAARDFIQIYSIKMPSGDKDDPGSEVRGVIVIKEKEKSKAKERKGAISLWKRVGKRTIHELRNAGGSAAEVRRKYNLFVSKQPTARLRGGVVVQEWVPLVPPPPVASQVKENLGEALSQIAFAHDINIENPAEVTKPSAPTSEDFGQQFSQDIASTGMDFDMGIQKAPLTNAHAEGGKNKFMISNESFASPSAPPQFSLPPPNYEECVELSPFPIPKGNGGGLDNPAFLPDEPSFDPNSPYADIHRRTLRVQSSSSQEHVQREGVSYEMQNFVEVHNEDRADFPYPCSKTKRKMEGRAMSIDIADERNGGKLPRANESLPKLPPCQKRERKTKKKRKKKFFTKSRVEDANQDNQEESSEEHSICVNVKTQVSTRLSSARTRRHWNRSKERNTGLHRIEECSESNSSECESKRNAIEDKNDDRLVPAEGATREDDDKCNKTKKRRRRVQFALSGEDKLSRDDDESRVDSSQQAVTKKPKRKLVPMSSVVAWEDSEDSGA